MQIFVLGATKVGKSTFARHLQEALAPHRELTIYEAGRWARWEFAATPEGAQYTDEFDPDYKNALTDYAMGVLRRTPSYSLDRYREFRAQHFPTGGDVLVAGVRNPDDFIGMLALDRDNYVVHIESYRRHEGSLGLFEEGLDIINRYLDWKWGMGSGVRRTRLGDDLVEDPKVLAEIVAEILQITTPA
jgi:hypothetical protein